MWKLTDANGVVLAKRLEGQTAAEYEAARRWPGCEFDGDLDNGATRIYVYLGDDHVGFLEPPQGLLDRLRRR